VVKMGLYGEAVILAFLWHSLLEQPFRLRRWNLSERRVPNRLYITIIVNIMIPVTILSSECHSLFPAGSTLPHSRRKLSSLHNFPTLCLSILPSTQCSNISALKVGRYFSGSAAKVCIAVVTVWEWLESASCIHLIEDAIRKWVCLQQWLCVSMPCSSPLFSPQSLASSFRHWVPSLSSTESCHSASLHLSR